MGEVRVGGSKNAALPILFGGIVTGDVCVFTELPRVSDVLRALEILRCLGARICFLSGGAVRVDYSTVRSACPPAYLCSGIRGSTYLLGAMLTRFGRAVLPGAGGCDLGERPIDQHLLGFAGLGATARTVGESVVVEASLPLVGCEIALAMPSVGATANLMIAAAAAHGKTVIRNAAAEPHVAALADFLCAAGAQIEGVGTSCITVTGVPALHGVHHRILPDMIEAGTYLCLGAACGGPVRVCAVCPEHLAALCDLLLQMGVRIEQGKDYVTASAPDGYCCANATTGPYPAFPTDLHPQLTALLAVADRNGEGSVTETVFSSRFRYAEELRRMGADVSVKGNTVKVTPKKLRAATLRAPDLRGGAALLIAALATNGKSEITNAAQIARGYEHLELKLRGIGADVCIY